MIDFSLPCSLIAALLLSFLLPLPLWIATRLPVLHERNPLQFLIAVLLMYGTWFVVVTVFPAPAPADASEWLIGFMALSGGAIVYLEIWGLLSRGYTLSILAALYEAQRPLTPTEIAHAYRGGDGLDWIMKHRLGGLEGSGMIVREGDCIKLSAPRGLIVAWLYKVCISILGLRRTG